jgi:hypothetical protein
MQGGRLTDRTDTPYGKKAVPLLLLQHEREESTPLHVTRLQSDKIAVLLLMVHKEQPTSLVLQALQLQQQIQAYILH